MTNRTTGLFLYSPDRRSCPHHDVCIPVRFDVRNHFGGVAFRGGFDRFLFMVISLSLNEGASAVDVHPCSEFAISTKFPGADALTPPAYQKPSFPLFLLWSALCSSRTFSSPVVNHLKRTSRPTASDACCHADTPPAFTALVDSVLAIVNALAGANP